MRAAEYSPYNSAQVVIEMSESNSSRLKEIAVQSGLDPNHFEASIAHQVSISTVFQSRDHFVRDTIALADTGHQDKAVSRLAVVYRRYLETLGDD